MKKTEFVVEKLLKGRIWLFVERFGFFLPADALARDIFDYEKVPSRVVIRTVEEHIVKEYPKK